MRDHFGDKGAFSSLFRSKAPYHAPQQVLNVGTLMPDQIQPRATLLPNDGLQQLELTIVMPCLDEAETLGVCVTKAQQFLAESGISGEVLIADNGSTDGSQAIALSMGARVVPVPMRGYGAALIEGIRSARGTYIIMGDSDDSYDFRNLQNFVAALRAGNDLVMGNRFRGGIAPGAMPPLHRYLGNPVLSLVGRLLFHAPTRDFHCGLRGFSRARILSLDLHTTGMEFASEMVVKAANAGLRITEVPTTLSQDGRSRPPHLRTWRDGWRHLRFLLIYSPRWLFFYPGLALMAAGLIFATLLLPGPVVVSPTLSLDVHSFMVACACIQLGLQSIVFAMLARRYATISGLLPHSPRYNRVFGWFSLENLLLAGLVLLTLGGAGVVWCIADWSHAGFGVLAYDHLLRVLILSLTSVSCAIQLAFSAFLGGIMEVPRRMGAVQPA